MSEETLPFLTRFVFAWVAFFRILFDGRLAARLRAASEGRAPELPPPRPSEPNAAPPASVGSVPKTTMAATPRAKQQSSPTDAALQLLALLQRDGRFVDFIEQDVTSFSDAEVGAAARVVHEGCRKALRTHAIVVPIRTEDEGARVTLAEGFAPQEVKLSGNVQGSAPYTGVLRHRGWRASGITLPTAAPGHDPSILAPAEIEL